MPDRCPLLVMRLGRCAKGEGGLELLDLSNFAEACLTECEVEHVAATTEAVLFGLEDTTTFEVLVFLLDREVHHGVDHVLKLVRTSHLTSLVDSVSYTHLRAHET